MTQRTTEEIFERINEFESLDKEDLLREVYDQILTEEQREKFAEAVFRE